MLDASWLKVLTFFGVWTIIWLPIALIVSKSIGWQPNQTLNPQQKLVLLASLYILSPLVLGWKMRVENLSFASLGLSLNSNIFGSIVLGLIIAFISLFIVFGLESALNLVSWHFSNLQQLLTLFLPILLLGLAISLIEELIFRGYVFSTLVQDNSYWFAATVSSIIFALLHLVWEQKETIPQLPGLCLMGMVLIGTRLINDGDLGLAIGLHAGWICGLTCIDSAQLLTYKQQDSILTGINQQPLAGVAGILCLLFTGLIMWLGYSTLGFNY